VVAAIYLTWPREPVYEGKPVSYWIRGLGSKQVTHNEACNKAFHQIGTNAVPVLIEMLRTRDSKSKLWLEHLCDKQSLVRYHFKSAEEDRISAFLGFSELGPLAQPAIPALINLLGDEEVSEDAARSLVAIGAAAVEPLISTLTNRDPKTRIAAIEVLGEMGPVSRRAVPALSRIVRDEQGAVALAATQALKRINPE